MDEAARQELLAESPRVFLGGLIVAGTLDVITWSIGQYHPLDLVMLAAIAALAVATQRRLVHAAVVPWVLALAVLLSVGVLCVQVGTLVSVTPFGYMLVLTAAFPPLTLLWRPTLVVGAAIVGTVTVTALTSVDAVWGTMDPVDAILQIDVALAAGIVALYFRRRSLATGLSVTTRLARTAHTDRLTGVLNRRGLEEGATRLSAERRSVGGEAFALFIDVDGLKAINDSRGHDSGDDAIRAVASAAAAVVRRGDLLGRWGGDEFVILGVGEMPDPATVELRIRERLRDLVRDEVGRLGVSVGAASGTADVMGLIAVADADMYARRAAVRGTDPSEGGRRHH